MIDLHYLPIMAAVQKIALVAGREVFEWKCVWVGGMEKRVFMKVGNNGRSG